ncbi:Rho-binding antiterminator [Reinekea thalattae]|uniref:Uncharacterized protein n=1 Tax=Reinekea thalattae TaxID=2593301 RepID=A0A5C8ZA00_9GAMM|nr:Rho-binding antiterminator [Reinekea thalattae]TXR53640.1 hypothetical protein FME95_03515 [Reinekea thalattae]
MISCAQYDFIELVCTFHYPVRITTFSGDVIEGIAHDTARSASGEECIQLQQPERYVVLTTIKTLQVTQPNPHLQQVSFDS